MRWSRSLARGALLLATAAQGQMTVASVYLPEYQDADWEALRGSIITKVGSTHLTANMPHGRRDPDTRARNQDHSMTAYTIFCADQAPQCRIVQDIPFVFTQGPSTLKYGGSASSGAREISVDLHCELAGTTAATCTGSSSFGSNYHHGTVTGPTQTVWTSTFSGPAKVVWAALTLATPGPGQGTTNIDGTVVPLATSAAGAGAASDARAGCVPARGGVVLSVGVAVAVAAVGGWGW
ncbi:hypothetical protein QBC39DRAFT_367146 [Podospora conica]|nr:hypothetical protein QBC39DRAFT_367146 [Schizothecium conicum]